jgi:hypothetical protein
MAGVMEMAPAITPVTVKVSSAARPWSTTITSVAAKADESTTSKALSVGTAGALT